VGRAGDVAEPTRFGRVGRRFRGPGRHGHFPTDLETAPSTQTGDIHTASFLVNVASVLLAAIFLGLSYGGNGYWQRRKGAALGFAALLIAAFVAQFLTLHRGAPYGITNRVFVAVLMSTSFWLRQVATRGQETERE
jgi:hypothetical protein